MSNYKALLAIGAISLFIGLAVTPASASCPALLEEEQRAFSNFMEDIHYALAEATSFTDFLRKVIDICKQSEITRFPILSELIQKLLAFIMRERTPLFGGGRLADLLSNFSGGGLSSRPTQQFIISHGTYKRVRRNKENRIVKNGFAFLHYYGGSNLLKDRTTIVSRKPFDVRQRVIGNHFVIMLGFRGIYIDIESRITGHSYTLVMGRAFRARAFDLHPLK